MAKKKPTQKEFLKELEKVSGIKTLPKKKTKKPTQEDFLFELEKVSKVNLTKPTEEDFLLDLEKASKVKLKGKEPKKNAVYQRIYRLQNKLDKKTLSEKERKEAERSLAKEKSLIGYTGITGRENQRLSSERKSLTSKQTLLLKQFKDRRTSKKNKNRIAKELMKISTRLKDVNSVLGIRKKRVAKKKQPKKKKGEILSEVPGWVVKPDYIDPALKVGFFKKYIIDGKEISKSNPDKIYDAWQDLYARLLLKGSKGRAIIIESAKDKSMQIDKKP